MLDSPQNIHIIGIGGSGISALAYLFHENGHFVSGSDQSQNSNTKQLKNLGIDVHVGHVTENLNKSVSHVIYTEAINKKTNPEYVEAKKRGGIKIISYFQALGELSKDKKTIVVTGTHGKTTTTAMLGQALLEAGMDPTVIVGSRVPYFDDHNIHVGKSEWLVVEGCEYRRSFLNLKPFGMILLNCEWDHVDYYKTKSDYLKAFEELAEKLPKNGFLIYNQDDENCKKIAKKAHVKNSGINMLDSKNIPLKIPGHFNQHNAGHALEAAEMMGLKKVDVLKGLSHFSGTTRRMEIKGEVSNVLVIDDYAHHPTEIRATLGALKEKYPEKKLICVFQPHQYSRTLEFLEDFKTAFKDADQLIIPNIYEARDSDVDKQKINAEYLCNHIPGAIWGKNHTETLKIFKKLSRKRDINHLLVTMGAGNVYEIGEAWLAEWK